MIEVRWHLEKYQKSLGRGQPFAVQFTKLDTVWSCVKCLAIILDVPVSAKYEYDTLKQQILAQAQKKNLENTIPDGFFATLDRCILAEDPEGLARAVKSVAGLAESICR